MDKSPIRHIPIFDKLTQLEISNLDGENLKWAVECLRSCPKLEILVIDQIYVDDRDSSGEGVLVEQTQDVPQCLLSHLKEFTLRGYGGWKWEFEFVRYIMDKAKVLRTISILSGDIDASDKYNRLIDLASCPRGSEHCRLLFR
ncbi:hypothetical protein QN277_024965 [Acacia crassicarpa]|uniref:FBD domain-containing protein n=1 Tax=Acacia crassicarpa TaxID=499986 RepID=A0AAE1JD68_9FABA|nr:hypothetical protein QN277_024965 [Acacia crassicarpa]